MPFKKKKNTNTIDGLYSPPPMDKRERRYLNPCQIPKEDNALDDFALTIFRGI